MSGHSHDIAHETVRAEAAGLLRSINNQTLIDSPFTENTSLDITVQAVVDGIVRGEIERRKAGDKTSNADPQPSDRPRSNTNHSQRNIFDDKQMPVRATRSDEANAHDRKTDYETLVLLYPPIVQDEIDFKHVLQQLPTIAEIKAAQRQDAGLQALIAFLEDKTLPTDNEQARRLVLTSEQFMLDPEGLLLHLYTNRRKKTSEVEKCHVQIVVPNVYVLNFLKAFHDDLIHAGKNKLFLSLRNHYFWDKMYQSCAECVKFCSSCLKCKETTIHTNVPTKNLEIISECFSSICIDTVGPLTLTNDHYRYALTVQCEASRFLLIFPIKTHDAQTIVNILFHQVFCVFGFPKSLKSDRAQSFLADITKTLFDSFQIKHLRSSSYHPKSQSRLERIHRVLGASLRQYPKANQRWNEFLQPIAYGLNGTPRAELAGYSPAELVFNRQFLPPMMQAQTSETQSHNVHVFRRYFAEKFNVMQNAARDAQEEIQLATKTRLDAKPMVNFKVGQSVLLFSPMIHQSLSSKLTP